jgi:hypothetical protein
MKLNKICLILLIFGFVINTSYGQNSSKASQEQSLVWLGVDYTLAKFIAVTESPQQVIHYLPAINNLLIAEQEKKYNIKKYFNKTIVLNEIATVNERNAKIDPSSITSNNSHSITKDDVKKLISDFNTETKTGMGLIFVAESMSKPTVIGSFYVVFFDLATKEIIDSKRMEGKAAGFGFRNFWAGAVFEVMKNWNKSK